MDFGKDSISKLFNSLFVPTLLGMLSNVVFILTDGIFVGNGINSNALAIVNLVQPIMILLTGIGAMLGIGCSIISAIDLAKEKYLKAKVNTTLTFIVGILISLTIITVLYLFPLQILRIIGCTDILLYNALEYYIWFVPTAFFLMVQLIGEFIIRLDGSPKYVMFCNITPAIINIILDYIFIFPCKMGLKGAAIATDIGTFFGAILTLYYMISKARTLQFVKLTFNLAYTKAVYEIIKKGLPSFLNEISIGIMILLGNIYFGKYLHEDGLAAYSIICYITPIVSMVFITIASSAQPIISFNYSLGNKTRIKTSFSLSIKYSLLFSLLASIIFVIFPNDIVSVFINNGGSYTHKLAANGLALYCIGFIFSGININTINFFQSIERTYISSILIILKSVIILWLAFNILPLLFNPEIVLWLVVPISEFLIFPIYFFIKHNE